MAVTTNHLVVEFDGEIIDYKNVEYEVNRIGFPVPTLDIKDT